MALAKQYGITVTDIAAFERWRASHQPFHWFVEFYGILVARWLRRHIGNPPYVEYRDVKDAYTILGYHSLLAGDLYAYVTERSCEILTHGARIGLIVPIRFSASTDSVQFIIFMCQLSDMWVSEFRQSTEPAI